MIQDFSTVPLAYFNYRNMIFPDLLTITCFIYMTNIESHKRWSSYWLPDFCAWNFFLKAAWIFLLNRTNGGGGGVMNFTHNLCSPFTWDLVYRKLMKKLIVIYILKIHNSNVEWILCFDELTKDPMTVVWSLFL